MDDFHDLFLLILFTFIFETSINSKVGACECIYEINIFGVEGGGSGD